MKKEKQIENVRNVNLNEDIQYNYLQLISNTGENLGKKSKEEALQLANNANLDLVVVSTSDKADALPVAKIMNYSKKLYEEKKKSNLSKKKSNETKLKEIRISIKISNYDLAYKIDQSIKFLLSGCRVKFTLVLKGRERGLRETLGVELMEKVTQGLMGVKSQSPKELAFDQENEGGAHFSRIFYLKK
jgi:translation initiation factor IF-3